MEISFCTTCCNRLYQLAETFGPNVAAIEGLDDVEWVIVNLNSRDALDTYMAERLRGVFANVVYAREESGAPWHMARAKNLAHRLGRGRILMNLDCDNLIGDSVGTLRRTFGEGARAVHLWSGISGDGTCGRIAVARELFHALGGYDESFCPVGFDDIDFLRRLICSGIPVRTECCPSGSAIPNTREESTKHCDMQGLTWIESNRRNMMISDRNVLAGRFKVNQTAVARKPEVTIVASRSTRGRRALSDEDGQSSAFN